MSQILCKSIAETLSGRHIYSYLYSVFYTLQDDYCNFLFNLPTISDNAIGALLLVISLLLLTVCLLFIVKILRSALEGKLSTSFQIDREACHQSLTHILICAITGFMFWLTGTLANLLKKFINADIPYVPWLTGYVAILVGAIMTFLVQSSSVFTSTLTPLVGVGLISVSSSPTTWNKYVIQMAGNDSSQKITRTKILITREIFSFIFYIYFIFLSFCCIFLYYFYIFLYTIYIYIDLLGNPRVPLSFGIKYWYNCNGITCWTSGRK